MQSNAARAGVLAVLAAAVVLFIVLSGDDDSGSEAETGLETVATGATTQETTPPTASIVVEDGQPVGGVQEVEVSKGDRVALQVGSDQAGEVHVHGYEIDKPLKAGGSVLVTFPARIDGVFEIELHLDSGDVEIAELTVQPG